MSSADYSELQKLIKIREKELQEKKKLLEKLQQNQTILKHQSTILEPDVDAILHSVLADIENAKKTAREKTSQLEGEYFDGIEKENTPKAVKLATKATVDLNIVPEILTKLNKGLQCDTSEPSEDAFDIQTDIQNKQPETTPIKEHESKHVATLKPEKEIKELTEDQKKEIFQSSHFKTFFQKASKVIEKAVHESEVIDILADYNDICVERDALSKKEQLSELITFKDMQFSMKRPVLGLEVNTHYPETFLACYGLKQKANIDDPEGCAVIWNVTLPSRPEYTFFCQSAVRTAIFDTYHPHCILGGTFTGYIVIWDTRVKSTPVQRTALHSTSHWDPICNLQYVGNENFNSLISADEGGRLCVWSRSMMVHPNEYIDLKSKAQEYNLLCLGFSEGETNTFLAGTLGGSLVEAQIRGTRAGISNIYQGHEAPVTSLKWHPSRTLEEKSLFSDLVLTSSYDWTCKLWSLKTQQTPLVSFEAAKNYCLTSEWHPKNPVIFASGQADGTVHLWDLSNDVEVPGIIQNTKSAAVLRMSWSTDGNKLLTGDENGAVTLWGVPNNFAIHTKDANERFSARLRNLRQQKKKSDINQY